MPCVCLFHHGGILNLVGMEGVEPPRLSAVDFESTTSAIPSHTRKIVDRGRTKYLQHVSRLVKLFHASV